MVSDLLCHVSIFDRCVDTKRNAVDEVPSNSIVHQRELKGGRTRKVIKIHVQCISAVSKGRQHVHHSWQGVARSRSLYLNVAALALKKLTNMYLNFSNKNFTYIHVHVHSSIGQNDLEIRLCPLLKEHVHLNVMVLPRLHARIKRTLLTSPSGALMLMILSLSKSSRLAFSWKLLSSRTTPP